jgi:hypothetical protein
MHSINKSKNLRAQSDTIFSSPLAGEPKSFFMILVGGVCPSISPHRRPQEGVDSPTRGELEKRLAHLKHAHHPRPTIHERFL